MASILPTMVSNFITIVALTMPISLLTQSEPCPFNPLCTCRDSVRNVSCLDISFAEVPQFLLDSVTELNLVRTGIEVLKDYAFQGIRIKTLNIMENELSVIRSNAFYGSESTLTSVDLSSNRLRRLPEEALNKLQFLDWLSLQSNNIDELPQLVTRPNLRSLLVGNNQLFQLIDGCFSELVSLTNLNLDHNAIAKIGSKVFPSSLQNLSLSNNLLRQMPTKALQNLQNLTWIHMGGNLFNELSNPLGLPIEHLYYLDFSDNLLTSVPSTFTNNSVTSITTLRLDLNNIETLDPACFQKLALKSLSLANNRLTFIQEGAFEGLQNTLKTLDISYNLLTVFPNAIKDLVVLSHLSLRKNFIKYLDVDDLYACRDYIEVLDLSGNKLDTVPGYVLRFTRKVSHLYLQENVIYEIPDREFELWGQSLIALNLESNKLLKISANAFLGLKKLKELRLSFNNLLVLDLKSINHATKTLENLEIGYFNAPLLGELTGFENVKSLEMDHNNLTNISYTAFQDMYSLIYCDLEGNKLQSVPLQLFQSKVHTKLKHVVLANNDITVIDSNTFHDLPLVTDITLSGNNLRTLKTLSFRDMEDLKTIEVSRNQIQLIEKDTFTNLSSLTSIFLQDNSMKEFSFEIFRNVGDDENPGSLNLANNKITRLKPLPTYKLNKPFIKLYSLDLSNNRISGLTKGCLKPVGETLHYLFLSSNRISSINLDIFAEVPKLQVIHINNNNISVLPTGVFQSSPLLQIIDLSHNNISFISKGTFNDLSLLRVLDLSYNGIKILPDDVFAGSKIERLNLSNNRILDLPLQSLSYVQSTLRYLDVSQNKIYSIPVNGFNDFRNLLSLNLSSNQLTDLNDTNFNMLDDLLHLDMSHNILLKLSDELFKPLISLQTLVLKNVNLSNVPSFPLQSLRILDMSFNLLQNISNESFLHVEDLQYLDLSHNYYKDVPRNAWPSIAKLTYLDISYNPIQVLNMKSFLQLERLRELDVRGLNLKYLDSRTLHNLKFLNTFKTNTYGNLRTFQLKKLLSKSISLQRVLVEIDDKNLTHQLQWTFGSKLRDLTITGRNLQYIVPDAFLGLQTHNLTLRITNTKITQLPNDFMKYLGDVSYLTLDLRGNLLTSMDENVLNTVTTNNSEDLKIQHIYGGILLENNPWICDCNLLWLGNWIRHWMRKTLKVQTLHFKSYEYSHAQNLARKALCTLPNNNVTKSIVDLDAVFLGCGPNGIKDNISDNTPDNTSYYTLDNVSDYSTDNISDYMQDNTPNNISEYTQDYTPNYTQNNTQDDTPGYAQNNTEDDTPDYMQYDSQNNTHTYTKNSTEKSNTTKDSMIKYSTTENSRAKTNAPKTNYTKKKRPKRKPISSSTTFQIKIWMTCAALVIAIYYHNHISIWTNLRYTT